MWRVGAAKVSIGPQTRLFPLPQREGKAYDRVGEEIFVRALGIQAGSDRVLCLSFELFGTPFADTLRARLSQELRLKPQNILICDTYNHCAPREDLYRFDTAHCGNQARARTAQYFDEAAQAAVEAAHRAMEEMRNVRLRVGRVHCPVNINRDERTSAGWALGKNGTGPTDRTLTVWQAQDAATGRIVALAVHGALYGNMCYLAGREENPRSLAVGGDLPGRVCAILEAQYQGAAALWFCGAAGDQDPLILASYAALDKTGRRVMRQMTDKQAMLIRECQAQWIACDAVRALESANELPVGALACRFARITLAGKKGGDIPAHVMVIRMGTRWIVAVSGAPGARLGEAIRACLPCGEALLITHAGPYTGYLVDEASCAEETFEAQNMRVLPGEYEQRAFACLRGMADEIKETDKKKEREP